MHIYIGYVHPKYNFEYSSIKIGNMKFRHGQFSLKGAEKVIPFRFARVFPHFDEKIAYLWYSAQEIQFIFCTTNVNLVFCTTDFIFGLQLFFPQFGKKKYIFVILEYK